MSGEPDLDAELGLAKTGKFGVGFITWSLERAPEMLTKALRYSPFCVFLSFGDPSPFGTEIANSDARLICQVQFLSQIDVALKAGAAAVVVQGTEAGGHGATRSTFPFVPETADYLERHTPETLLLAAGGIADGRGLAAALMLGADGVVAGSRFWASAEALTPRVHTDKAAGVTGDSTVRTKVLDALRGAPWPREYSPQRSAFLDRSPEENSNLGSLLLAQNADAPIYIPVAKTRIPAAPVTCVRICGST